MRRTNFTECANIWGPKLEQDPALRSIYGWHGPVFHIPKNETTQISTWGCKVLCGNGTDYYDWSQSSSTITTWILPVIGMVAQAPFVSNAFWETIFTTARWIGSPMASLAYVLWNIRTTARAALMVDMATCVKQRIDDADSEDNTVRDNFRSIRDSFYILTTMNQYNLNPEIRSKAEAEGLLRLVLFSKDLRLLKKGLKDEKLTGIPDDSVKLDDICEPRGYLNQARQDLAWRFRTNRRRGVVPVFISVMWFLFSFGISIQDAFGLLGQNSTAHDLALGCLLCWLPVLILCSIVDRNPVSSDDVKDQLNELVNRVRESIGQKCIQDDFLNYIPREKMSTDLRDWIVRVSDASRKMSQDFFKSFAGQGRVRWHYGVAHPILTDIERAYIKDHGRNWLRNEAEARDELVLARTDQGLDWFDYRELWQVSMAIFIVIGCVAGAWIISYMTPTVGLGCRSGGYTVFVSASAGLLIIEMFVWWFLDAQKQRLKTIVKKQFTRIQRTMSISTTRTPSPAPSSQPRPLGRVYSIDRGLYSILPLVNVPTDLSQEELANEHHKIQKRFSFWFFRPLEIANMTYLLYLIMAQTLGADETCECMTSLWGSNGGYLDFTQWDVANSEYVNHYWIAGTCISTAVMGVSMIYIVLEWCMQSHLSTADNTSAATGLQHTRRFRWLLYTLSCRMIDRISPFSLHWHPRTRVKKEHRRKDSFLPITYVTAPPVSDRTSMDIPRFPGALSEAGDERISQEALLPFPSPTLARSRSPSEYSSSSRQDLNEALELNEQDPTHLSPILTSRRPRPRSNTNETDLESGLQMDFLTLGKSTS